MESKLPGIKTKTFIHDPSKESIETTSYLLTLEELREFAFEWFSLALSNDVSDETYEWEKRYGK